MGDWAISPLFIKTALAKICHLATNHCWNVISTPSSTSSSTSSPSQNLTQKLLYALLIVFSACHSDVHVIKWFFIAQNDGSKNLEGFAGKRLQCFKLAFLYTLTILFVHFYKRWFHSKMYWKLFPASTSLNFCPKRSSFLII